MIKSALGTLNKIIKKMQEISQIQVDDLGTNIGVEKTMIEIDRKFSTLV